LTQYTNRLSGSTNAPYPQRNWRMIPAESRRELHVLFPDMDMGTTPVRPHLRGRSLDKVIARHQDNGREFTH